MREQVCKAVMRSISLLLALFLFSAVSEIAAQQSPRAAPGARVRVTLGGETVEGTVIALTRDSLVMFSHPADSRPPRQGAVRLSLALSSVTDLETLVPPPAPPIAAKVRLESQEIAKSVTGIVLDVAADSLMLRAQEPSEWLGDTLKIPLWSVTKFRVLESAPIWSYSTPNNIEYYREALAW